jgi:hypothetical protein
VSHESNPARELAARRRVVEHACEYCGRRFEGLVWARFCCAKCRAMSHYFAKRAKQAALRAGQAAK